jgi:beta-galactosidase
MLISEANGHMFPTKPWDRWERLQEHALRHARVMNDAMADYEHAGVFQWCMFDYPTHKQFGSGDRHMLPWRHGFFPQSKAGSVYLCFTEDAAPVLEISSPMDIGDYDGGHLDTFYAFTNADEVRLYKNNDFVKSFRTDRRFKDMKHGPVKIDDTIGDLLKTKEGFTGKKEAYIHDACCCPEVRHGRSAEESNGRTWLGHAALSLKYEEGVELYGKYVGGWGGDSTTWKFEAVKTAKLSRLSSRHRIQSFILK